MAHIWLDDHGRDIISKPQDGLSFVQCVQYSLVAVYKEIYSIGEIKEKILSKIRRKSLFYKGCVEGMADIQDVVKNIETYFWTPISIQQIYIDLLVMATLNVFRITILGFSKKTRKCFS